MTDDTRRTPPGDEPDQRPNPLNADEAEIDPSVFGPPGLIDPTLSDAESDDIQAWISRTPAPAGYSFAEPEAPPDLSDAASKRRKLADVLATTLVERPRYNRRALDMISTMSLPARLEYAPALQQAVLEVPDAARRPPPGAFAAKSGPGGTVLRLHADTWSLVFRLVPATEPVLIVTDDMPDLARRVDTDPDWTSEVDAAVQAVRDNLPRFSPGQLGRVFRPREG
jgi:hypothetical protein